jgi:hypothetical protein
MWPKERKKPQRKPKTLLISAITKKIAPHFVASPEGRLWSAALHVALVDLSSAAHKDSALKFLLGPMPQMQLAGVEPEWIRYIVRRAGLID